MGLKTETLRGFPLMLLWEVFRSHILYLVVRGEPVPPIHRIRAVRKMRVNSYLILLVVLSEMKIPVDPGEILE